MIERDAVTAKINAESVIGEDIIPLNTVICPSGYIDPCSSIEGNGAAKDTIACARGYINTRSGSGRNDVTRDDVP